MYKPWLHYRDRDQNRGLGRPGSRESTCRIWKWHMYLRKPLPNGTLASGSSEVAKWESELVRSRKESKVGNRHRGRQTAGWR